MPKTAHHNGNFEDRKLVFAVITIIFFLCVKGLRRVEKVHGYGESQILKFADGEEWCNKPHRAVG